MLTPLGTTMIFWGLTPYISTNVCLSSSEQAKIRSLSSQSIPSIHFTFWAKQVPNSLLPSNFARSTASQFWES